MTKFFSTKDIEAVYEENFERIYRFFYYKSFERHVAEDLTSETFVCFVDEIQKKKVIVDPQKFLYGIAKIIFIKHLKKKYQNEEYSTSIEELEDFATYVESEPRETHNSIYAIALKFIQMLPTKQKEVLTLRLIDRQTLEQICKRLKKNMNYVKTTQKRGIANLKKLLICTPRST